MINLIEQTSYNRDQIKSKLAPTLLADDGPIKRFSSAREPRVLLKPNFVMPAPKSDASTTHPDFYMAIAELLIAAGVKVGIGESPAFGSCASALKAHGVIEQCRQYDIEVVEFRTAQVYVGVEGGGNYESLSIARELEDWDFVINLPKLKTHQQFTFTGASKNLYGCVTGKRKFVRHNQCANDPCRFAAMIRANAAKAKCLMHIGDGIDALHVKGPRGGVPYPLQRIIVADDYLEHDWLFCQLIGLDPRLTPLFAELSSGEIEGIADACSAIVNDPSFVVAKDFVHAPLIDISFQPWHVLRSAYRTLQYRLGSVETRS